METNKKNAETFGKFKSLCNCKNMTDLGIEKHFILKAQ